MFKAVKMQNRRTLPGSSFITQVGSISKIALQAVSRRLWSTKKRPEQALVPAIFKVTGIEKPGNPYPGALNFVIICQVISFTFLALDKYNKWNQSPEKGNNE